MRARRDALDGLGATADTVARATLGAVQASMITGHVDRSRQAALACH